MSGPAPAPASPGGTRARALIDTARRFETPEGVELRLTAAGVGARAGAWIIDAFFRAGVYVVAALVLLVLGGLGQGLMLIVVFIGEWFYGVLFEVLRQGQTPGKRAAGVRVVHDDGTPVGWNAALLRNLLRFADFLPIGYGIGLISMSIHPRFKRLGDLVAGTLVVYVDPAEERAREQAKASKKRRRTSGGGTPEAPPAPQPSAASAPGDRGGAVRPAPWVPPVPLQPAERAALLAFYDRADTWTAERQVELADRLAPLTGATGELGRERALGLGAWLRGEA